MKELTDEQLKKATIFDLTDDVEVVREIYGDAYLNRSDLESVTPEGKIFMLLEFAEHTNDRALSERLEKIFEKELAAIFIE